MHKAGNGIHQSKHSPLVALTRSALAPHPEVPSGTVGLWHVEIHHQLAPQTYTVNLQAPWWIQTV